MAKSSEPMPTNVTLSVFEGLERNRDFDVLPPGEAIDTDHSKPLKKIERD